MEARVVGLFVFLVVGLFVFLFVCSVAVWVVRGGSVVVWLVRGGGFGWTGKHSVLGWWWLWCCGGGCGAMVVGVMGFLG